ncbi:MAG: AAA family ATPase [Desulfuromonas sp.]|nr:MAG: AAA family ATPase [Desulfuromonas sp.]
MQTILQDIQETVTKYANIISRMINVDVDIVDRDFVRIAGTGVYRDKVNESMSAEAYIYREVIATGETQVVNLPGKDPLCQPCTKKNTCVEKFEICTPIKLGQEIIGSIGLVCFTDDQKSNLLQRFDVYLEFVAQIADFISAKAYENREHKRTELMIKLMGQVVDKTDMGVIAISRDDTIINANSNALQQLGLSGCFKEKIDIRVTGDLIGEAKEYKVMIDQKEYFILGDLLPVDFDLDDYAKMLAFHDIKTVKSKIYELTQVGENIHIGNILGHSSVVQELKAKVQKISTSTSTILIRGESGTGKELFARAIHRESDRRDEPFVAVNCGSIPDSLMESELFGYIKGAFTGADPKGRIGKFELANKGTLFLDEIGDLPLYVQVKLLRVLQERKITRLGSNNMINIDVRIIAATHKNLTEMIKENTFREDLFYRLNVVPFDIAPLRERRDDIEPLSYHFINKYCRLFGKDFRRLAPEVVDSLIAYDWPGNVRELENTIEFMVNMMEADGLLTQKQLPRGVTESSEGPTSSPASGRVRPLRELESEAIEKALKVYGHSYRGKKVAAQKLGIGVATLYRKLEAVHLSK